jgi:hypothetical protein
MAVELNWGPPPEEALANPTQSSSFYTQVAAALRAKPGEWAQVPRNFASVESARSTAIRIRTGRMASMPKGQYEAIAHEKNMWVRYMPPEEGTEEGGEQPAGPRLVPTRPARDSNGGVSAQVRAWARDNGWPDLPAHGRLPQDAIQAYHAAMDARESGKGE